MSEILAFRASAASAKRGRPVGWRGQVVIFPGVRVEYHDGGPARPPLSRADKDAEVTAPGARPA